MFRFLFVGGTIRREEIELLLDAFWHEFLESRYINATNIINNILVK